MRKFLLPVLMIVIAAAGALDAQTKRKAPVGKAAPAKSKDVTRTDEKPAVEFKSSGAADADGWKLYESKSDFFTAAFPPTPIVTDETGSDGKKTGNRYYNPEAVTPAKINLTVIVSGLEIPVEDPETKSRFYASWLEGLMSVDRSGGRGVKVRDREFAIKNTFGWEVVVDRGDYRYHGRAICIGGKFYQLAVGSLVPGKMKPEEYTQVDRWVRKFFDSFQPVVVVAAVSPPDPLMGAIENGVYRNEPAGFTVETPADWIRRTDEQIRAINKINREMYPGAGKNSPENAFKGETTVFTFNKYPVDETKTAVYSATIQKLSRPAALEARVQSVRALLTASPLKMTLEPVQYKTFGKVRAAIVNSTMNMMGAALKQRAYFIVNNGYALSFSITYEDDADLLEADKKIQALTFK
jgi:hypothetical protein